MVGAARHGSRAAFTTPAAALYHRMKRAANARAVPTGRRKFDALALGQGEIRRSRVRTRAMTIRAYAVLGGLVCVSALACGDDTTGNLPEGSGGASTTTTTTTTTTSSGMGGMGGSGSANGVACTAAADCSSGNCVDGVCCDTACADACDSCNLTGSEGTCTVVAAGAVGDPSCAPYACNGAAACPTTCSDASACAAGAYCDTTPQTCKAKVWGGVQLGTTAIDAPYAVATDSAGNVIVVGATLGDLYATSAGVDDMYVAKYSGNDGSFIWGKQFGTTGQDHFRAVAIDGSDNVLVGGWTAGDLFATTAGGFDAVIMKLSGSDGSTLWDEQYGSAGDDTVDYLAVDSAGNPFIVGWTGGDFFATNAGGLDGFVAKYAAANGALDWGNQEGTTGNDQFRGVAIDASDNVVVVGDSDGDLFATNAGGRDAVAAKLNGSTGAEIWSIHVGVVEDDSGQAVAIEPTTGDVLLTGGSDGDLFATSNNTSEDSYVARRAAATGASVWGVQFGSPFNDSGHGIAVDSSGDILVARHLGRKHRRVRHPPRGRRRQRDVGRAVRHQRERQHARRGARAGGYGLRDGADRR
jgi:hypothetical protein